MTPQRRGHALIPRARVPFVPARSGERPISAGVVTLRTRLVMFCALFVLILLPASSSAEDDGDLVMELESATFELSVRDARDGERGPTILVSLGSPEQATPLGAFPLERIILNPSWRPGVVAKSTGALPEPASLTTPMGVLKIPFALNGVIAVHGGGDERALGKPLSAGCVRATDADLLRMIAWLDEKEALTSATEVQNGEIHRIFKRPIQLVVR